MPPGLNFRHPQQNEDNELDIARKTVLDKLDIILSKDDPILKLLNNSIVLQERVELRQRRMLDEFKTKQLQALTQQLSLIDTHTPGKSQIRLKRFPRRGVRRFKSSAILGLEDG